ncbi:MAG: DUF4296 domain-containing protein [Bacteroidaceae bacterium]|nr:DUF4296 domain-containing protein [Bacteroidaceae bacterium]
MRCCHTLLAPLLGICLALTSCGNRPDGVMRPGKMEDVLYDYHIAHAIVQSQTPPGSERDKAYEEAVFRKHGVTADEFYASLRYYEAHPKEFAKIYTNLDERFNGESGARAGQTAAANDERKGRDIWPAARQFVLSSQGNNRYDFDIPDVAGLKAGDRLEWTFSLRWVYSQGRKNGTALIVLRFANDSIATFSQPLYGTGLQTLVATVGKDIPKSVSGFVYQDCPWDKKVRLLMVSDVALRVIEKPAGDTEPTRLPDTLSRRRTPPAFADSASPRAEGLKLAKDSAAAPIPPPTPGRRLSREEGERRILDSIRVRERGRQPHFQ